MGCRCCWGHTGFASLEERFDPVTVHHICISLVYCKHTGLQNRWSGFESLAGCQFLLGVRLVWSKATVFEIVITGSNPVPSANIPR